MHLTSGDICCWGSEFTLFTDQQALKYLLTAPTRTSRQERWHSVIKEFMPDIRYVKGTGNVVADALSRRVDLAAVQLQSGLSGLHYNNTDKESCSCPFQ